MWQIGRQDLYRWYRALMALPLAVSVETAHSRVGILHCRMWHDNWSATLDALEERNIAAINMVLLGIDDDENRAGPTGKEIVGIDHVIAVLRAGKRPVAVSTADTENPVAVLIAVNGGAKCVGVGKEERAYEARAAVSESRRKRERPMAYRVSRGRPVHVASRETLMRAQCAARERAD